MLGTEDLGDAPVVGVLPVEAVQIKGEQLPYEVPERSPELLQWILPGCTEYDREFLVFDVLHEVR